MTGVDKRKMRVAALILLAVLIAPQLAGASVATPSCPNYSWSSISTVYNNDLPLMLIAVLVSFAIAALFFLVGVLLRNDRIRNFGVGELYEAIATALMVVFFLYLANAIFTVLPSITQTGDPYALTCTGLMTVINNVENQFGNLFDSLNVGQAFDNSFGVSGGYLWNTYQMSKTVSIDVPALYSPPGGKLAIPIYPSVDMTLSLSDLGVGIFFYAFAVLPLSAIASFLVDGMYVLWSEFYLMAFFAYVGPVLFATGVVFRALFPTRGFGGMLMATAMGFYIVMPTLFAFALLQTCSASCAAPGSIAGSLGVLNSFISSFWLMILFYPPLIIALTYSFIQNVSNFLGQATSVGGRLRGFV